MKGGMGPPGREKMNAIYEEKGYSIIATSTGESVVIETPAGKQVVPLLPASELAPAMAAAIRKAGKNPADFFGVGKFAVRAAARSAWDAAVVASKARRAELMAAPEVVRADQKAAAFTAAAMRTAKSAADRARRESLTNE